MAEHVEFARHFFATFNREGVEAVLTHFDPEIEWLVSPESREERIYKGHEGLRKLARSCLGRIARVRVHFSWEEALEAAGLSELTAHEGCPCPLVPCIECPTQNLRVLLRDRPLSIPQAQESA